MFNLLFLLPIALIFNGLIVLSVWFFGKKSPTAIFNIRWGILLLFVGLGSLALGVGTLFLSQKLFKSDQIICVVFFFGYIGGGFMGKYWATALANKMGLVKK